MSNTILTTDILNIKKRLIKLSEQVVSQHKLAIEALLNKDDTLANKIIDLDRDIDNEHWEIKKEINFILTKEPLAKYLRRAISYFIITKELERLGDYAKHIAKFTTRFCEPSESSIRRINEMYNFILTMMKSLVNLLDKEDIQIIEKLSKDDDLVDSKTIELNKELVVSFAKHNHNEKEIGERVYLLNLVNSLERAGDHIINICEEVYYIITGNYTKL
ncbi:phosphate signaling complex protein PhoU [Mycoplasma sp. Mirounga ES2805-ORL]|uniref:phosphate signaling complex protein PhoU n=1 Tax=Mycoplasma sp. Mirounga ES2805-ORL TaxID=754514 RepID=UPI00197C9670|nr:phosphate signaling complex protein PhoU [Mycoplasma sp. Mirounga ES2805-ORL]QSF13457.1 phosphate signaling complex protein PhoU [Mycoplasma sp. Mirounga ES2805-ORL]